MDLCIREPNETFEFDKLSLTQPNGMTSGTYLTKIQYKREPLYIQTPKTKTKQGIVVSSKKGSIDLILTNDNSDFIEWIGSLEERIIALLYEKRNLWFNTELELSDIEASFASPLRAYKGGKQYLVRAGLEYNKTRDLTIGPFMCKVFDEKQYMVPVEYVRPEHNIISVLEVHGVKFTSKSFQLELILRQSLVIPDIPLFTTCMIKSSSSSSSSSSSLTNEGVQMTTPITDNNSIGTDLPINTELVGENHGVESNDSQPKPNNFSLGVALLDNLEMDEGCSYSDEQEKTEEVLNGGSDSITSNETPSNYSNEAPSVNDMTNEKNEELSIVELSLDDIRIDDDENDLSAMSNTGTIKHLHSDSDNVGKSNSGSAPIPGMPSTGPSIAPSTIKLKKPNAVYYELYKQAKERAREAKKYAIQAYLEAQNIKANYMLNDLDESDEDS